jgi:two-component sensor histidine kinase/Tfp pilus assembly protein PilF
MNYFFTILFFITYISGSLAQTNISTIDKLNSDFFNLYDQDLEKAFQIAKQALNASRKVKYAAGEGGALYRIGIYYDIKMKSDSARVYLFKGIEKLKTTKAYADLGDAYNNLGAHYYYQFDYKKAIQAHNDAITTFKLAKEKEGISKALNNIGICYKNLGDFKRARITYNKSLEMGRDHNDSLMISIANASISGLFIETKQLDSALFYNEKSERFVPKNDNYTRITIWFSRGEIYKSMGKFQSAEIAYLYGLDIAQSTSNLERIQYFFKSLAELKEVQYDYKSSLNWYKKYDSLRDLMYNKDKNDFLASYEKKFKLSEKEQAIKQKNIQLLKAKNEGIEQQNKIQLGIILILILITLSTVFFLAFRLKKRNHEIAQQKLKETDLLSRELHHRIKNNLQLVSSLLTIELHHISGKDKEKVNKIKDSLQIIARLHGKLYESKKWEKIKLSEIMDELKLQSIHLLPGLSIKLNIHDKYVDLNAGISLGIIINELITNSLKHAFPAVTNPEISISIEELNGKLLLNYSDNGTGLSISKEPNSSFGSELLSILLNKIGRNLKVNGEKGFNLQTELTIPYYTDENSVN